MAESKCYCAQINPALRQLGCRCVLEAKNALVRENYRLREAIRTVLFTPHLSPEDAVAVLEEAINAQS